MPKNSTSPKQNDSRCKPKKKRRCLNCVIQKLEDPKNKWKFVRPQNIAKVLRNPKQQLKHQPTLKNRIWPNFNPPKKGQDSCLNFENAPWAQSPYCLQCSYPAGSARLVNRSIPLPFVVFLCIIPLVALVFQLVVSACLLAVFFCPFVCPFVVLAVCPLAFL